VGPARLEREQLWRTPISPAENLWYLGLLYRGFEQLPNGAMREVFFAPAELVPLLPLLKTPDRVRRTVGDHRYAARDSIERRSTG